jgi:hypothetical protein
MVWRRLGRPRTSVPMSVVRCVNIRGEYEVRRNPPGEHPALAPLSPSEVIVGTALLIRSYAHNRYGALWTISPTDPNATQTGGHWLRSYTSEMGNTLRAVRLRGTTSGRQRHSCRDLTSTHSNSTQSRPRNEVQRKGAFLFVIVSCSIPAILDCNSYLRRDRFHSALLA